MHEIARPYNCTAKCRSYSRGIQRKEKLPCNVMIGVEKLTTVSMSKLFSELKLVTDNFSLQLKVTTCRWCHFHLVIQLSHDQRVLYSVIYSSHHIPMDGNCCRHHIYAAHTHSIIMQCSRTLVQMHAFLYISLCPQYTSESHNYLPWSPTQ